MGIENPSSLDNITFPFCLISSFISLCFDSLNIVFSFPAFVPQAVFSIFEANKGRSRLHHKPNPDRKPTVQQSVSAIRMAMRFGDYALCPTFADEKRGQNRRG
ncbi:hypothetical protein ACIXIP_07580 [Bacteroides fragilis]